MLAIFISMSIFVSLPEFGNATIVNNSKTAIRIAVFTAGTMGFTFLKPDKEIT